jgi:hypothetical protein
MLLSRFLCVYPQLARAYPIAPAPARARSPDDTWLARIAGLVHPSVLAAQLKLVSEAWLQRCPRVNVMLQAHKEVSAVDFKFGRTPSDPASRVSAAGITRQSLTLNKTGARAKASATVRSVTPVKFNARGKRRSTKAESLSLSTLDDEAALALQAALPSWLLTRDDSDEDVLEEAGNAAEHVHAMGYKCPHPGCPSAFKTLRTLQIHQKLHVVNHELSQGIVRRKVV